MLSCHFFYFSKISSALATCNMHLHFLGICGTFMGSLAQLAVAKGHRVTGSDTDIYPPMSTQLTTAGVDIIDGYEVSQLDLNPDLVVVGNVISRGNPVFEAVLNRGLPYTSGPQWLGEHILQKRWVLAIAGTHGKTTTSSMLAWILDYAGMAPGYLIGGVPRNFSTSARLGETPYFVIEADEYDSALFDKRSKFIHYRPRTLVINNLEFDHADIFPDLAAIQQQFHHLVRTLPQKALIIVPQAVAAIEQVLNMGCWSEVQKISFNTVGHSPGSWNAVPLTTNNASFEISQQKLSAGNQKPEAEDKESSAAERENLKGIVNWQQLGEHNIVNGLAAVVAAHHVGVPIALACEALSSFEGVKRRMECLATIGNIKIYDDFAHHPTAIEMTLAGLRARVGKEKIIAIIEPRSNTMRMGGYSPSQLANCCTAADFVCWYQPANITWDLMEVVSKSPVPAVSCRSYNDLITTALKQLTDASHSIPTHIIIMSNGSFGGIHQQVINALQNKYHQ
jgi:UDP-N-acetylmuramate: L-alanyl-gamma-D-glutamyl-meso-diaminopimelate ligase